MKASFVKSSKQTQDCPKPTLPEYAFIGRSNVGKSSLINMLVAQKGLAKTSQTPGKTQLINHFLIDETWYLVDLPGYGYAKVSKSARAKWDKMIRAYLLDRANLNGVFVLIDIRHKPQAIDLDFMYWLGINQVPFVMVFTKLDKISKSQIKPSLQHYEQTMLEKWEEMPKYFLTSAEKHTGKEALITFIDTLNKHYHA
ncbi:MAG: ribosome biogenesis GTP-binding protein YihA/YsxC [Thermonemataceae bacterium]